MKQDEIGTRMKIYESVETDRKFIPLLPIYARIDGRSFSKFTKPFDRPYDIDMSMLMIETTKKLVEQTNAVIGYCQSDEISLCWNVDDINSQIIFDGKIFKLVSNIASMATSFFITEGIKNEKIRNRILEISPTFDCRVFQLPNKMECTNTFLWRNVDCTKNAISQAARSMFSHKELTNKSGKEMKEMIASKDVNFDEYPLFFTRGTFVKRRVYEEFLTDEQLSKIPENHRPTGPVKRHKMEAYHLPPLQYISNKVEVVFDDAIPMVKV